MVGAALVRRLAQEDVELQTVARSEVDLRDQAAVFEWFAGRRPVVFGRGEVGGIIANDTQPVDFLYDNLLIEANVITTSYRAGVEKLLFLSSSCVLSQAGAAADDRRGVADRSARTDQSMGTPSPRLPA